jgi:hypothetical protein
LVFCTIFSISISASAQDEIAPFKLKDVSGDLTIGYSLDDRAVGENFTESNLWREELSFRTQSYIYHPAMLDMQIDGGLEHVRDTYKTQDASNSENELLFNYDARFNFLARKQYPFTVYAGRRHPEMVTNLLGRFLVRIDEFGALGRIVGREAPWSVRWDLGRVISDGSGFGSTVDEELDRANVSSSFTYLDSQTLGLSFSWFDRLSRSGSAGLPIQESFSESVAGSVNANNLIGRKRPLKISQSLDLSNQTTTTQIVTDVERLRYRANLLWNGFERHEPFLNYLFLDEDRQSTFARSHNADLGTVYHVSDKFEIGGRGNYQGNEGPDFKRDRAGISARADYSIPLPIGTLRLNGSVGANRNDQEASADTRQVFDESKVLVGTVPVPLNNGFVVEETVVVTNVAQSQTFVVDLDYRLVTVGSTTTIERIITGAILDGQEVLVSYEYETGGTVEFRDTRQSAGISLNLKKYLQLYANWFNVDNAVKSGEPTTPLNDVTSLELGIRGEVGFATSWSVGGQIRYTDRNETIAPATGGFYDVYLRTGYYRGVSARLAITKQIVDNEFSTEDVNLLRYFVSINARLSGATQLAYSYMDAEDDGGSVVTKNKQHNLQFDWRYRLVAFTLRATYNDNKQGTSGRGAGFDCLRRH